MNYEHLLAYLLYCYLPAVPNSKSKLSESVLQNRKYVIICVYVKPLLTSSVDDLDNIPLEEKISEISCFKMNSLKLNNEEMNKVHKSSLLFICSCLYLVFFHPTKIK